MQPNQTAYSLLLIAVISLFGSPARASHEWLEPINNLTQQYIAMVDSTESSISRESQDRFEFVKQAWIPSNEIERRLNRLVEKLVNEEYSPYDFSFDVGKRGEFGIEPPTEQDDQSDTILRNEERMRPLFFAAILDFSSDCLEHFEASYQSLVVESGKNVWSRMAPLSEVQSMAIRSRFGNVIAIEKSSKKSIVKTEIDSLDLVFGRSVIPTVDFSAIEKSTNASFSTWDETRLLAMQKYVVPKSTWIEFRSFSKDSHEVRISKGNRGALR